MYYINGREYEWADISIRIGKKELFGFTSIEYKESQEVEYYYGKSREPCSFVIGNKSYSGKISITQSELVSLKESIKEMGLKSLLDITLLSIIISYGSDNNGSEKNSQIQHVTLQHVKFLEIDEGISQGDKFMIVDLPFLALKIETTKNLNQTE